MHLGQMDYAMVAAIAAGHGLKAQTGQIQMLRADASPPLSLSNDTALTIFLNKPSLDIPLIILVTGSNH